MRQQEKSRQIVFNLASEISNFNCNSLQLEKKSHLYHLMVLGFHHIRLLFHRTANETKTRASANNTIYTSSTLQ
jgi:hypothetical protein